MSSVSEFEETISGKQYWYLIILLTQGCKDGLVIYFFNVHTVVWTLKWLYPQKWGMCVCLHKKIYLVYKSDDSEVLQLCPTLCNPMDCSLPGSSVHGIFQARILEWVAISFSRRSSWPRDWTQVSHIIGRRFTAWATREVLIVNLFKLQVQMHTFPLTIFKHFLLKYNCCTLYATHVQYSDPQF